MKALFYILSLVLPFATTAAAADFAQPARFAFGAAQGDAALVSATTAYSDATGFGFEPGASLHVARGPATAALASEQPFQFSLRVPEGNYRVTVTLGDPGAAGDATVKAETRRLMLEHVRTAAGEFVTRTFTVNVRGPRLRDGTEVHLDSREMNLTTHVALSRTWDDKLTLGFSGSHAAVSAIEIQRADDAITLFLTGDSTVTDQPAGASWGQMATRWFKPAVAVANHAESGETLKGFLKERRWDKVLQSIKRGDYVLIEFGTNDSKSSGPQNIYPGQDFSETYAPADTVYQELLRRFVADVRARGGQPIIASPSARRGEIGSPTSLAAWAKAAMTVARQLDVPGIDLNAMGVQLNRALGADADKQFADRTHHVEYGAYLQAKAIVLGIQQAKLPLAEYIVDDFRFDPAHPDPLPAEFHLPPDGARNREGRALPANAGK